MASKSEFDETTIRRDQGGKFATQERAEPERGLVDLGGGNYELTTTIKFGGFDSLSEEGKNRIRAIYSQVSDDDVDAVTEDAVRFGFGLDISARQLSWDMQHVSIGNRTFALTSVEPEYLTEELREIWDQIDPGAMAEITISHSDHRDSIDSGDTVERIWASPAHPDTGFSDTQWRELSGIVGDSTTLEAMLNSQNYRGNDPHIPNASIAAYSAEIGRINKNLGLATRLAQGMNNEAQRIHREGMNNLGSDEWTEEQIQQAADNGAVFSETGDVRYPATQ